VAQATSKGLAPAQLVLTEDSSVAALIQQGVGRETVLQFLGIIEQRAAEILASYVRRARARGELPDGVDVGSRMALPSKENPDTVRIVAPRLLDAPDVREAAMHGLDDGSGSDVEASTEDMDSMRPLSRSMLQKQAVLQLKKEAPKDDEERQRVKEDAHGLP